MSKNQRIEWIDIAKGIGIILVVLGHCVVKTDYVHKFIFSFHMPLFFILSGYCFHAEKYSGIKEVFLKKAIALLVPYFKFVLLGLIVTLIIPGWREGLSLKGILTDLYLGYPSTVHITSIWYLVSLYGISVVFYILYLWAKKTERNIIIYIGVVLSGMAGYAIYIIKSLTGVSDNTAEVASQIALPGGRLPLTIDASLMALVFFALGVWIRKKKMLEFLTFKGIYAIIGFALTTLLGVFLNVRVNIHGCSYGNILYFFACALSGTIMVICLSQLLSENKSNIVNQVKKILLYYGKNSLFMFAMQSLFIHLFVYIINECTGKNYELYEDLPTIYGMIGFGVITVVCLPLSHRLTIMIKRCGVRKYEQS